MNLVMKMSNSDVFGSPMILTGRKPVSPFGADIYARSSRSAAVMIGRRLLQAIESFLDSMGRDRRIHQTVVELSRLDNRALRDIGLDRSAIISVAQEAEAGGNRRYRS